MSTRAFALSASCPQPAWRFALSALALACTQAWAVGNETEIVSMPTARLAPDGHWRWQYRFGDPYVSLTTDATLLPWLQAGGGMVRMRGVSGFGGQGVFAQYGDYKDKILYGRIKLFDEGVYRPATTLVLHDVSGTGLFRHHALVLSKQFGPVDASLGWGDGRIKGWFGGLKVQPASLPGWTFALERDAFDYRRDVVAGARAQGVRQRVAYGVEYAPAGANWGVQINRKMDKTELALQYRMPLNTPAFTPKPKEPAPYTLPVRRPTAQAWHSQPKHAQLLADELAQQGFEQIELGYARGVLHVQLAHPHMPRMSQAVGQAAHTALLLSPLEMRELRITYRNAATNLPFATYSFIDPSALYSYMVGEKTQADLAQTVHVAYAEEPDAQAQAQLRSMDVRSALLAAKAAPAARLGQDRAGNLALSWTDAEGKQQLRVQPRLEAYVNGPKVLQYALKAQLGYQRRFGQSTYGSLVLSQLLSENISGATAPNNSPLPQVRSSYPLYQTQKGLQIEKALLTHYWRPGTHTYARASAGLYELMHAGAGAQVLYAPYKAPWAFDVALDYTAQRAPGKPLQLTSYRNTSALASVHYRLPEGITATVRAGRFLAGDKGGRLEVKRRFASGVELGAWYSVTDAVDKAVTHDGSNYRDKGVFANIPFDLLLPVYTRSQARLAISPWTRDMAQMVSAPDLYALYEEDLLNLDVGGLERLSAIPEPARRARVGQLNFSTPPGQLVWDSVFDFASQSNKQVLAQNLILGAGTIAISTRADKRFDGYARRHGQRTAVRKLTKVGNALPVLGLGVAGAMALDDSDPYRSRVALSAVQAAGTALVVSSVGKHALHRSRPESGRDHFDFSAPRGGSFPSNHTAVMFALVTPFAQGYNAPWLYGLGALTAGGRVAARKHWLSDVVAGGLIGYGLGQYFYLRNQERVAKPETQPNVLLTPVGVHYQQAF